MGIRIHKPTSAGRRNSSVSDFAEITHDRPERTLLRPIAKTGGRNAHGHITSRRRGGGHQPIVAHRISSRSAPRSACSKFASACAASAASMAFSATGRW